MTSSFLAGLHAGFSAPRTAIVELVERATGRRVATLDRVVRGYDNEVHRAGLTDDTTVFARIGRPGRDGFTDEAWAMERARDAGVPVPAVLALDTITEAEGRPAMVVEQAPGQQLAEVLPELSAAQRRVAMTHVGRTLGVLHSVRTAGIWRPDEHGVWPDPDELRRGWLAERRAERVHLAAAGLSTAEVEQTIGLLGRAPDTPAHRDPVLCHGDVSPEHVFVAPDLTVSGLIDWGMWHGGSAIGELAYVAMCHPEPDVHAIVAGHRDITGGGGGSGGDFADPAFRRAIYLSVANQVVGHIAHHVSIGDVEGAASNVGVLRNALHQLGG